jgi:hypothetical protein
LGGFHTSWSLLITPSLEGWEMLLAPSILITESVLAVPMTSSLNFKILESATRPSWFGLIFCDGLLLSSHDTLFARMGDATRPSWISLIFCDGLLLSSHDTLFCQDGRCYSPQLVLFDSLLSGSSSLLMTLSFTRMGDATRPSWFG